MLQCPFAGCDVTERRSDLQKHQLECSYRTSVCEYCGVHLKHHKLKVVRLLNYVTDPLFQL